MKKLLGVLLMVSAIVSATPLLGQTQGVSSADAWKSLSFLEGSWGAKATGPGGVASNGVYTFGKVLGGHIMSRFGKNDPGCTGPASFDCNHNDLFYIYEDRPGQPLKAIYFDNEGHVIHYDVTTPTPAMVMFLSEPGPGPRFRLTYELAGGVMTGKFQMQQPGQTEWHSYLEWSGGKE